MKPLAAPRQKPEPLMVKYAIGRCYLGTILAAHTQMGLLAVYLGDEPDALIDALQRHVPAAHLLPAGPSNASLLAQLIAFADNPTLPVEIPIHLQGTEFQIRVWQALRAIPVGQTITQFGRLDTLINNAGVMLLGSILNASTEEWERMIDLNLKGLLYTTHAALPHLIKAAQDSPRNVADIINISSVAGRRARAGAGVYNATKFGVVALTEALRQEVTGRHVRVSVVEPGVVRTELESHMKPDIREQTMKPFAGITPLEPEDIADVITFIVTRPWRSAINEVLVRPTEQAF